MTATTLDLDAALVLFSGGQDSATCLAWALDRFSRVETIGFDYGQRHAVEIAARAKVRDALVARFPQWGAKLGGDVLVDLKGFGALSDTALTAEREIAFAENGLPTTFVPGRNLVFFTAAAAHAYRLGFGRLTGGMCETDYSGYPDCRAGALDAMGAALRAGLDANMVIDAPLMHLTKADTWRLAERLGGRALVELIVEETHTCYLGERGLRHPWGYGCGTCPACALRAQGWEAFAAGEPAAS